MYAYGCTESAVKEDRMRAPSNRSRFVRSGSEWPRVLRRFAMLTPFLVTACGHDNSGSHASSTTYRLAEGSTILLSPSPAGSAPVIEEALSGTLLVTRVPAGLVPNAAFAFSVSRVRLESAQFIVVNSPPDEGGCTAGDGGSGCIDAPLAPGSSAVAMGLMAAVNDAPFVLSGAGSFVDDAEWPSFEAIELCGAPPGHGGTCTGIRSGDEAGVIVTLSAKPPR